MTVTFATPGLAGLELTVELGLPTTAAAFGLWDTAEWDEVLWGPDVVWQDVSAYARVWSTKIGRARAQNRFEAGDVTVTFANADGRFSSSNLSGPYAGEGVSFIRPGVPIRIHLAEPGGVAGFVITAFADSWDDETDNGFNPTTTVRGTDGLGELNIDLPEHVEQGAGDLPGRRIHRLLMAAEWQGDANIAEGRNTLLPTTMEGNALGQMQLTAESDGGELYVEQEGALRFDQQYHTNENPRSRDVQWVFADDPSFAQGLELDGTGTCSTPDAAEFNLTAGMFVAFDLALPRWDELPGEQTIVCQWDDPTNRGWAACIDTTGHLVLRWSTDGSTSLVDTSDVMLTGKPGETLALGMSFTPSTGSIAWWQNSGDGYRTIDEITVAATSVFNSTAPITIGARDGANFLVATVYLVALINASGGLFERVGGPDFRSDVDSVAATTLQDPEGHTWTLAGGATLAGASGVHRYRRLTARDDRTLIRNDVTMQRDVDDAVPQRVVDLESRALYKVRTHKRADLLCESDAQALGLAGLMVSRFAHPRRRVEQLVIDGHGHPERWPMLIGLRLRDRLRISEKRTTGDRWTGDVHADGIAMTMTPDTWVVTLSTSDAETQRYALWDGASWDDPVSAVWAY